MYFTSILYTSYTHTQCRIHVKCIRKNHIVNNLIEAYLRANPEKKRPEEDIKELDAKNKIAKDMVRSLTAVLAHILIIVAVVL